MLHTHREAACTSCCTHIGRPLHVAYAWKAACTVCCTHIRSTVHCSCSGGWKMGRDIGVSSARIAPWPSTGMQLKMDWKARTEH